MVTRSDDEYPPSGDESDPNFYVDIENDSEDVEALFTDPSPPREGHERWRPSPPPVEVMGEDWGGEWSCQIIGEEVDKDDNVLYEVRWDNWTRADGTNTTWEPEDTTVDLAQWKKAQKKRRRALAAQSTDIEVHTTTDIHNTATYLRSQAYDEKLDRVRKEPQPDYFAEMAKLLAKHQGEVQPSVTHRPPMFAQGSSSSPLPLRSNQRASTRQQTELSIASASSGTLVRASSKASNISSVTLNSASSAPALPPSSFQNQFKVSLANEAASSIPSPSYKGKGKEKAASDYLDPYSINSTRSHSTASSSKGKGKRQAPPSEAEESDVSMSSVHRMSAQRPSTTSSTKKKRTRIIRSESSEDVRMSPSPTPPSPPIRLGPPRRTTSTPNTPARNLSAAAQRRQLQKSWSAFADEEGAAPIYFVNDIDDEAIPELDSSFYYLESTYFFSPAVQKPDEGFLISCSCEDCFEAKDCDCQTGSDLRNDAGVPFFAYTHSGLFAFNVPKGMEVVECNKTCSCDTCDNRVSQLPRDVPIEIFKTRSCGWGVRPTIDVKRGKVLGIYTGLVIPREEANELPLEMAGYRFDLDGDEAEGIEVEHPLYSVDSRLHGNWTRFINHSCSPNLQIYLVLHDTPPQCGLPFIAFVASQDIPARTEFTFDYDPSTVARLADANANANARGKSKKKGRASKTMADITEGGMPCYCGSQQCRRFIHL